MNRCLILDLDTAHAADLSGVCAARGFEVLLPASIDEARAALADTSVLIAFIDLNFGGEGAGLTLLEESVPDSVEVLCMSQDDSPEQADEAVRKGAGYYFCKPFSPELIDPLLLDIASEAQLSDPGSSTSSSCVVDQFGFLRGSSPGMRKLYRLLRKVASTDASLMIVGESGTGKDLVAQTAHAMSSRSDGPFIAFNCAAVAETLAESELFGHERGSFSGAHSRHKGFFERAHGGTLFLDEITEMDASLQAKILRVIETRQVRRLGSEDTFPVDVRLICATNRAPADAVREGKLREDLYYRLAQFPLRVPPLRRRGEDIRGLAMYFLATLNQSHDTDIRFTEPALDALMEHSWPGNVRELKNYVERAYIVSESTIDVADLPEHQLEQPVALDALDDGGGIIVPAGTALADAERELILASLARHDGNKKIAAEELGISLKTLYNRLRDYEAAAEGDSAD
jgi:two-component system response regulator AtoC